MGSKEKRKIGLAVSVGSGLAFFGLMIQPGMSIMAGITLGTVLGLLNFWNAWMLHKKEY